MKAKLDMKDRETPLQEQILQGSLSNITFQQIIFLYIPGLFSI